MATKLETKVAINAYKCISTRDSENVIIKTVFDIVVGPPFGLSDHCSVNLTIVLEPQLPTGTPCSEGANEHPVEVKWYRWSDADYNGINSYLLNIDWSQLFSCNLTVDSMWCALRDVILHYYGIILS